MTTIEVNTNKDAKPDNLNKLINQFFFITCIIFTITFIRPIIFGTLSKCENNKFTFKIFKIADFLKLL